MKIFIDDERFPVREETGEWIIVRDPDSALSIIRSNCAWITHISFDNDLGFVLEGRNVMSMIFQEQIAFPRLEEIRVHSANVVAAQAMINLARSAQKAGILRESVQIDMRSALYEKYQTITSWYDDAYENEKDRLEVL